MKRVFAAFGAFILAFGCTDETPHTIAVNHALVTSAEPPAPSDDHRGDARRLLATCAALEAAEMATGPCSQELLAYARELVHESDVAAQPRAKTTTPIRSRAAASETTDPAIPDLLRDATDLADRITRAAARGQLQRLAELRARLNVLHRALKAACDPGAIPNDALQLLPRATLLQWRDALKRSQRHLSPSAALADIPGRTLTLKELSSEIGGLDRAISAYNDGGFHLARDALPPSFNSARWAKAFANENEQVARETTRQNELFAARFPDLWSPLPEVSASRFEWAYPRSGRARTAIETYRLDPAAWLRAETRLLAEFSALKRQSSEVMQRTGLQPSTKYSDWFVAQLNDRDLPAAMVYAKKNVTELSRDPVAGHANDVDVRHFEQLVEALRNERARRTNGTVSGLRRYPMDGREEKQISDQFAVEADLTAAERVYEVRLAEARWATATGDATTGTMPAEIAANIKRYRSEALSEEVQNLEEVATHLVKVELDAAVASEHAEASTVTTLVNARGDAEAAAVTLSSRSRDVKYATVPSIDSIQNRVEAVLFMLGIRSDGSPDGPTPMGTKPRPPPEAPRPSGGMSLTDAVLTSRFVQVREKLATAEQQLGTVQVQFERPSPATELGRRTSTSAGLDAVARGKKRFSDFSTDMSESRLPMTTGRGETTTRKTYDIGEVLNPSSTASVGGGIHFTQTAQGVPESGDDLVVSYDIATKKLRIRSSRGSTFSSRFTVDPQSLKALYRFAVSHRNMAISIENDGGAQVVILDPYFVDTKVGQDLTLADEIPWRFDEPQLPDGTRNPMAPEFKAALNAHQADRKAQYARASSAIRRLEPFGIDTDKAEAALVAAANDSLATLVDDRVVVRFEGNTFDLDASMRYMYLATPFRVSGTEIVRTNENGKGVDHLTALESISNGFTGTLVRQYGPLRRVREYAEIAAFLRWAVTSPRVKRIDFRSLIHVDSFDRAMTPTVDQIGIRRSSSTLHSDELEAFLRQLRKERRQGKSPFE